MSAHLDLYFLISRGYFVQSKLVPTRIAIPPFYRQENKAIRLHLLDFDPTTRGTIVERDLTNCTAVLGLGNPADYAALAENNYVAWDSDLGCFSGALNLYTDQMEAAVPAASGDGLDALFYIQVDVPGGERIAALQNCRVRKVIKTAASGLPTDVTDSQFADLLYGRLGDSDTIEWRRVDDTIYGDVRLKNGGMLTADAGGLSVVPFLPAPSFLTDMSVELVGTTPYAPGYICDPTTDTAQQTAGGQAGRRYLARLWVAVNAELSAYSGGEQKPGDDAHFYRGGTAPADLYNRVTLQVSSPARTYVLNRNSSSAPPQSFNYEADVEIDAGATVTLLIDSVDGKMYATSQTASVVCVKAAELPLPHVLYRSSVAAAAHTGSTSAVTKASVTLPPMGNNSLVRLSCQWSRPSGQVADALLLAKIGSSVLWRQRVGLLLGGQVDGVTILSNRGSQSSNLWGVDTEADFAVGSGSINTANAQTLNLQVQLEDSADSITLESVTITRENP